MSFVFGTNDQEVMSVINTYLTMDQNLPSLAAGATAAAARSQEVILFSLATTTVAQASIHIHGHI